MGASTQGGAAVRAAEPAGRLQGAHRHLATSSLLLLGSSQIQLYMIYGVSKRIFSSPALTHSLQPEIFTIP